MFELISVHNGYQSTIFEHTMLTVVEAVALSMTGLLMIIAPDGEAIWSSTTGY